jgi:periplasmic protein TonB
MNVELGCKCKLFLGCLVFFLNNENANAQRSAGLTTTKVKANSKSVKTIVLKKSVKPDTGNFESPIFKDKYVPFVEAPQLSKPIGNDADAVFRFAEKEPEFNGGADSLQLFLDKNLQYPYIELQNKIEGTVIVEFIVRKDGTLTDIKIIKSGGKIFDIEAIRLIRLMPKWAAGKQNGKSVNCYASLPINFSLNSIE